MADFALDPVDGDLLIEDGNMSVVTGDDAIVQQLEIRLQFFLGEWFLDQRIGIPYLSEILIKNPDLVAIRNVFRETVLTTPGISTITVFDLTVNSSERKMSVSFTASKDDGGDIDFNQEFILL